MCIGNTSNGWRYLVKKGIDASGNEWSHVHCVFVYASPRPETFPFTVSHKVSRSFSPFVMAFHKRESDQKAPKSKLIFSF